MHEKPDHPKDNAAEHGPAPSKGASLPEITVKAVILGVVLAAVLAGANAYLGLLAGMTVSASIPAAVISMAVLRMFRRSNILENNIVQTAASAGESLAAGVVFTFPALVILGKWTTFDYWQTTTIAALGGILGVLFTVPLRRALIVEAKLKFPEGVATAQVLRAGEKGKGSILHIVVGGLLGAIFKIGQTGLGLWTGAFEYARRVGGGAIAYFGTNLSPALVAVGYIVGINIAVLVFLGGAMNWFVAVPIVAAASDWPVEAGQPISALKFAGQIWSTQTRHIGVGAMIVGGLWAIVRLVPSLFRGIRTSIRAHRGTRGAGGSDLPRTERDVPMQWIGIALIVSVIPLFFLFRHVTGSDGIAAILAGVMLVAALLFSAVASYMAGLVGSSNNPISGMTIATILASALLLWALGTGSEAGPAVAILVGGVVCCAAAIGGDNLQDLKTGHIVGATPWKQQVMQVVGVLATAAVIAPFLTLLVTAYGLGKETGALPAPQAHLMASIARGVFAEDLPWRMIGIGMGIAVGVIVLDLILEKRRARFRTPVLAVAVGIYLPLELGTAILIGGLVAWAGGRLVRRRLRKAAGPTTPPPEAPAHGQGILLAAGLITGEALLGILLAVPIVIFKSKKALHLNLPGAPWHWPGLLLMAAVLAALLMVTIRRPRET